MSCLYRHANAVPCHEAQSQRKSGEGTTLNRIVKKASMERCSGEAFEAVERFESERHPPYKAGIALHQHESAPRDPLH